LAAAVGAAHVLTDSELIARYGAPWASVVGVAPLAVVRPAGAAEAAAVLRSCSERHQPVVLQGGNTGLVRGAAPRQGDIVLSTERLTGCGEVDREALQVVVGAGLTLEQLQRQLEPAGLELPVDLSSRGQATLGGMAATGAGGARAFRHGTMRAQVAGVEAVLADGSTLDRMRGVTKDSTGYDWASILVGSEGTLGLITRLRLRVRLLERSRAAAMVAFDSIGSALALAIALRDSGCGLEAAEFILPGAVSLVCDELGLPAPPGGTERILVLFEARAREDAFGALVAALTEHEEAAEAALVEGSQSARLWRYREGLGEALVRRAPVLKLDVALPLSSLGVGLLAVEQAARATAGNTVSPYLFGHLLDGNVHVNLGGVDPDEFEAVERAVLAAILSHGGSIGAEHGIGRAKARWLPSDRSSADIAAMRRVKSALDPKGILGTGILLTDTDTDTGPGAD
jgi:FAD/FMN-containing dehydrogenase